MTRGVRWLCVAAVLAAAILVAGCGGGGGSSTSSTTTTKVAKTTTTKTASKTTTTTSSAASTTTTTTSAAGKTTSATTSGTVSLSAAEKAQELTACKSAAKAYTKGALAAVLPANFASDIDAVCAKIASGDLKGAKQIEAALCNQVATSLPSGPIKSGVAAQCKKL